MKHDPYIKYPIKTSDGADWTTTVQLKAVINHPRIEVGDFSYHDCFEPVDDYARKLAPYLFPFSKDRLIM